MTVAKIKSLSDNVGAAQEPFDEGDRLAVFASYDVKDLKGDNELAAATQFAARLCDAPIALVNLIGPDGPFTLAQVGLDNSTPVPRSDSLCAHAMHQTGFVEICDTKLDHDVANFSVVADAPGIRFYAGVPLVSPEGAPLGALCVSDLHPRPDGLDNLQKEGLAVLAQSVMRALDRNRERNRVTAALEASNDRIKFVLNSLPDIAWSAAPGMDWDYFNARFTEVTGNPPPTNTEEWREVIHPDDFEASLAKLEGVMETASLFEDEWRLRQADGSYRWIISRAIPSTDDPATARWFGTLTDIHERYSISQDRELLAGELAHRIKNIFSVIIGLISLNARGDAKLEEFATSLSDTLRALSRAQSVALQSETTKEGKLRDLLRALTLPYGLSGGGAIEIVGGSTEYGQGAATPLALIFHELATNSAKYGALSLPEGNVTITVEQSAGAVKFIWRESGGPPAHPPTTEGFGSRLVDKTIRHQLGGTIEHNWLEEGLLAELIIPSQALAR